MPNDLECGGVHFGSIDYMSGYHTGEIIIDLLNNLNYEMIGFPPCVYNLQTNLAWNPKQT